jgi:DUF177 domain-containing protein
MMKVQLTAIPAEGLEIQAEMDPASLDLEDSRLKLSEPMRIHCRLVLMEKTVFVSGNAEAPAVLQCVRCLCAVPFRLRPSFQLTLQPKKKDSAKSPGEYHELHREEMDENFYSGEEIDLGELVREQLLLAVPAYPLCRAECRGLCPHCGADRNQAVCRCAEEGAGMPTSPLQESLKRIIKK